MTDQGGADRPSPRIVKWKMVLGALVLAAAFSSPFWGPPLLSQFAFFRVRKVEVIGAHYTPTADVMGRLNLDTTHSVWQPLGALADRVRNHAQIERVLVTRKLPGTIVVAITEREPVALVDGPNGLRAVDENGMSLPLDPSVTVVDAPIVATTPRDTAVYHLLGTMKREAPRLYAQVSTITHAGTDEILLRIGDVPVRALTSVTLARLSDIEPVEHDLARRQLRPAELDLRYRDQVIARLP